MAGKRKMLVAGLAIVLLLSQFAATQEKKPVEDTRQQKSAAAAQTAKSKPEPEAATNSEAGKSDRFKPSEQISEDLSVSFPVDI